MIFKNDAHRDFYNTEIANVEDDCYHRALVYTIGICSDTRRNFAAMYDKKERAIIKDSINAAWQTGSSVKLTRLAFNLFTDRPITAITYDETENKVVEDFDECSKYSVSDIFCCGFAPYLAEAIRIRYPEYFSMSQP